MNDSKDNNNIDVDIIDESVIDTSPISKLEPKVANTRYIMKTVANISKIFIQFSMIMIIITILIGLYNPELSKNILSLIWDKLGAVYLVIFGSILGKRH